MTAAGLAAAMVFMVSPPEPSAAKVATIRIIAAQIILRAPKYDIDPMLAAAVMAHESDFELHARGKLDERGIGQLKKGTLATRGYDDLSDERLDSVPIQVHLVLRHLARVRAKCGANSSPIEYLSVYAGNRKCKPTKYSEAIVALAESAR